MGRGISLFIPALVPPTTSGNQFNALCTVNQLVLSSHHPFAPLYSMKMLCFASIFWKAVYMDHVAILYMYVFM